MAYRPSVKSDNRLTQTPFPPAARVNEVKLYLAFGFVESPHDQKQPMCRVCNNSFSNEAMKPSTLAEHLKRKHSDKVDRTRAYFENLKNFDQRNTL